MSVVLSPIPRNNRKDGTVVRASDDYGKWAAKAAYFIALNERVAVWYEQAGPEGVKNESFLTAHSYTTPTGARLNAEAIVR